MRATIIINPRSGLSRTHGTATGSRLDRAKRWIEAADAHAEVELTTCGGHAAELSAVALAAGVDRVIVWGGDGTVNEAAGPLFGTATALAIVAGGSGDGLARSLGLPREPEAAMRLALTGQPRPIDVGWLAGRHFLNIAGIGFDAEVARRFNQRHKRGTAGYLAESLSLVWSYACQDYRITIGAGERTFSGPHFLAVFRQWPGVRQRHRDRTRCRPIRWLARHGAGRWRRSRAAAVAIAATRVQTDEPGRRCLARPGQDGHDRRKSSLLPRRRRDV